VRKDRSTSISKVILQGDGRPGKTGETTETLL
jgi:hypothetical protein